MQGQTADQPRNKGKFDFKIRPQGGAVNFDDIGAGSMEAVANRHVDLSSDDYTERFAKAKVYVKSAVVQATRARGGERIETVLADGTPETVNTCNEGDFIVTNPGGEQYVLTPENFAKRYEPGDDGSYRAKGVCRAFQNPTGNNVSVTAPWGEEQHGDKDAMFAVAVDPDDPTHIGSDRYIIGGDEFKSTYIEA